MKGADGYHQRDWRGASPRHTPLTDAIHAAARNEQSLQYRLSELQAEAVGDAPPTAQPVPAVPLERVDLIGQILTPPAANPMLFPEVRPTPPKSYITLVAAGVGLVAVFGGVIVAVALYALDYATAPSPQRSAVNVMVAPAAAPTTTAAIRKPNPSHETASTEAAPAEPAPESAPQRKHAAVDERHDRRPRRLTKRQLQSRRRARARRARARRASRSPHPRSPRPCSPRPCSRSRSRPSRRLGVAPDGAAGRDRRRHPPLTSKHAVAGSAGRIEPYQEDQVDPRPFSEATLHQRWRELYVLLPHTRGPGAGPTSPSSTLLSPGPHLQTTWSQRDPRAVTTERSESTRSTDHDTLERRLVWYRSCSIRWWGVLPCQEVAVSYRGDDVPTLPWSRHIPSVEHDPADKTVVTEDPWFLEQELRALDPNNRPTRLTPYAVLPAAPEQPEARAQLPPVPEPEPEPKPDLLVLTFNVGSDPADPDDSSASVVPLRAGPFRVPETFINRQPGLWARVRRRLFGLACLAWGLVTRTLVLRRVTATN